MRNVEVEGGRSDDEQDRYEEAELAVSDEELTRQALEAAPEED